MATQKRKKHFLSLFSYRGNNAEKKQHKEREKSEKNTLGLLGNPIHQGLGSDEGIEEKLVSSMEDK